MQPKIGDRIMVDSERAGEPPREGEVLEIIEGQHAGYHVRWAGGHESTIRPFAGTVHFEPRPARKSTRREPATRA
jgi:hypothetical protein